MRAGIRRILGTAAALAIVLHTALWGIAPTRAALSVDPFTVICHSEMSGPASAPDEGPLSPPHACDHCNLCNVSAPPLPPGTAFAAHFGPVRTLQILRQVNIARHDDASADFKLARGPPAFA